jgi:hypothetical protein
MVTGKSPISGVDVTPYADYHMIMIHDLGVPVDEWPRDPWDRSCLTGLLAARRVLEPTIWSRWGFLPVRFEAWASPPELLDDGRHIVEASMQIAGGALCIAGWAQDPVAQSTTDASSVVVRVTWLGLPDDGHVVEDQEVINGERLVVQFWAGSLDGVRVIRQWPLWRDEALRVLFSPLADSP